jgi:hypothetical protein
MIIPTSIFSDLSRDLFVNFRSFVTHKYLLLHNYGRSNCPKSYGEESDTTLPVYMSLGYGGENNTLKKTQAEQARLGILDLKE